MEDTRGSRAWIKMAGGPRNSLCAWKKLSRTIRELTYHPFSPHENRFCPEEKEGLGASLRCEQQRWICLASMCNNVEDVDVKETLICVTQQHWTGWPNAFNKLNSTMMHDAVSRRRIRLATSFDIIWQTCIQQCCMMMHPLVRGLWYFGTHFCFGTCYCRVVLSRQKKSLSVGKYRTYINMYLVLVQRK